MQTQWFYLGGTSGRDYDHCHLDCVVVAGSADGARGGAKDAVRKNVKEMALAAMGHEQANGHLPTGGWGYAWVGDPRYGFGVEQPGGFFYNILPFMEQQELHDMTLRASNETDRANVALSMIQTPLTLFNCPTRRQSAVFPVRASANVMVNTAFPSELSVGWLRGDYKVNGGTQVVTWGSGPSSLASAAGGIGFVNTKTMAICNGICYQRSRIRFADITDGTSNTYLVGEKVLNPDEYFTGLCYSDDQPLLGSDDLDLVAWTNELPCQDTPGYDNCTSFGSAHTDNFNVACCDGSVRAISYSIDKTTHEHLGSRNDDQPIDAAQLP